MSEAAAEPLRSICVSRICGSGKSAEVGVYGSSPEQTVGRKSFFECFDYSGKLIAIELNPPVNTDSSFFCDCAHRFIAAGVDALTLTDSPLARGRADPMGARREAAP